LQTFEQRTFLEIAWTAAILEKEEIVMHAEPSREMLILYLIGCIRAVSVEITDLQKRFVHDEQGKGEVELPCLYRCMYRTMHIGIGLLWDMAEARRWLS
jgi:hypothetical protein